MKIWKRTLRRLGKPAPFSPEKLTEFTEAIEKLRSDVIGDESAAQDAPTITWSG